MYCPRCAKQQLEGAKFCRECGTDLEAVALALGGKLATSIEGSPGNADKSHGWDAPNKGWEDRYNDPQTTEDWLRKQSAGVNFVTRGATLLGTVLLAGVAILGLFGIGMWPVVIWAGIFGWMGCWGVVYVAEGLGAIMQSRNMLRRMDTITIESDTITPGPGLSFTESRSFPDARMGSESSSQISVTEDTTARLNK